nr:hypothetical protein [uncultured Agathobacter sp.]
MIKKAINWIVKKYNNDKPLMIEWIMVGIISFIILCFFLHGDTENLIKWSLNMFDVTVKGNPLDFYRYSIENPNMAPDKYVSGTLYSLIIWAIWNIPIGIIKTIFGVEVLNNPLVYIWGKLFLVFCLCITMFFVNKIVKKITGDVNSAQWAMFLLASSVFIYIGVYYGGQNDIVICAFATAAVYCLMDGKNKWFYFLAGMAISVKYFFFIPYIAIILLFEKKVLKIIYKIALGVIPTGIYWLITRTCPMVSESASQGSPVSVLLKEMVGGAFPVVFNNFISLFLGMLLIIYILAYLTIPQNDDEKYSYVIYYIVATSLAMLLFSTFQYYRVVMVCPFIAILMVIDKEKYRINVIMETIISISLFIILIIQSGAYLFVSSVVNKNVVKLIFGTSGIEGYFSLGMDITSWVSNDMLTIFLQILATVVVTLSIFILVLNNPRAKLELLDIPSIKMERWIYWLRTLVVVIPVFYVLGKLIV